ncbi:hypothetical protein BmR1_04g06355 [Babesia microti strain RI]|uniref:Uncharacterized protein n=1 Tax=Babesia microti (strain RI) TaxID=1133968 RepID=I7J8L5_BABMR|nr:hypothetical protein BmR1_04g06355 [Babesia microti strain RI]CCF75468.1 hypothetical protein BmR1_04g06355 [Babesia microti strain RI]|eukprot:XP_012649876.1 hypothetical protein BmR1_04g06355 [Babesia microti strain RI]
METVVAYFAVSLVSSIILVGLGVTAFVRSKSLKSLISSLALATLYGAHTIVIAFYYNEYFAYIIGIATGLICVIFGYFRMLKRPQINVPVIVLSVGWINFAYYGGLLQSLYYHYNCKF